MNRPPHTIRLAVTADLHYGITSPDIIAEMAAQIAKEDCAALLIAGDIGEPAENYAAALHSFRSLDIPRALVAGNHDLWAGDYPSLHLWDDVLPYLTRQSGFAWLDGENVIIGDVGICGTIGWYDYSAKDPRLTGYDDDRYAREKGEYNYDAIRIDWGLSDQQFAANVLAKFRERITSLQNNLHVRHIVVVTHVPPFEEQIVRNPADDFHWNVNNAYFGNLTLGNEICKYDKVRLTISGHTHVGVDTHIIGTADSPGRSMRIITVGSQYYQPKLMFIDITCRASGI